MIRLALQAEQLPPPVLKRLRAEALQYVGGAECRASLRDLAWKFLKKWGAK